MGAASRAWKLEIEAELEAELSKVRDKIIWIATEALDRVKRKTPVDTGHALNNWILTIGVPDGVTMTPEPAEGTTEADSFAGKNMQALAAYPEGEFPAIYLQNNLPYALALEYGHSKQAPAGMVAMTVAELELLIQGIEI